MTALYVLVVGLSAFLLFQIQPLISKVILPRYGGGASIWITCLIFFQLVLLLGYASSHLLLTRLGARRHLLVQSLLVLLCLFCVPLRVRVLGQDLSGAAPSLDILLLLAASVGLPYFLLSTTSPVVQHWFGVGGGARLRNPYVLYALSNAGSLLGLLTYPVLVEPNLSTPSQLSLWSAGFVLYALLLLGCILSRWRQQEETPPAPLSPEGAGAGESRAPGGADAGLPGRGDRSRWVVFGMIPSAALVVITHHLTMDIANFPFLWVLPLGLYLISFIICFLFPGISRPRMIRSILVLLPTLALVVVGRGVIHVSLLQGVLISSAAIFMISTYYHGELEKSKPTVQHLTAFYLYLSLGACGGSILTGLVAPLLLKGSFEFILVILTVLYGVLLPYLGRLSRPQMRASHAMLVILLVGAFLNEETGVRSDVIYRSRSFYGSYKIREKEEIPGEQVAARLLFQGTTVHGGQARYGDGRFIPLTYYHEKTAVGQAFARMTDLRRIGLVGLGTGVISIYGREGQSLDFYEIDEVNIEMAWNRFDLLKRSLAEVRTIPGDGRLSLRAVPDGTYDLLVLDAFTSGAIPIHLLTVEAIREYLRVLQPGGLLLFHVSNRHVRLQPVLAGIAAHLGLRYAYHSALKEDLYLKFGADWVALTRSEETLERLTRGDGDWSGPGTERTIWTDDFSDLWSIIKWSR